MRNVSRTGGAGECGTLAAMKFIVILLLGLMPLSAQTPGKLRLLDIESFYDLENVANPAISPDGAQIVFSRGWVDKMKDQDRVNLWIVDREGARPRELTQGAWRDTDAIWSPDGKRIAFISDRDGTPQIHVMWVDTREVAQLTRMERRPSNLSWAPDGKQIAFTAQLPDDDPILAIKLPKAPKGAQWAKPAVVIDRLSWARDGTGPVEKGYTHVFVLDSLLGGTPRQLTDGKYNHSGPAWSADAKTIFISGIRKPDAEYLRGDTEIYAIDVKSGSIRALTDRKGADNAPLPSPDGKWVAYTGYDYRNYTSHLSSICLMDAQGGARRLWWGALPSSPRLVSWSPDSVGVYYEMEEKGTANLYFVPLKGQVRRVTDGMHVVNEVSIARNGTAAAVRSSFKEPGALVSFSVISPKTTVLRKLVDVNDDHTSGRTLGEAEELWFDSKDGLKVQGWLMKPANFAPGRKYPMVLWIHGGPWSMYNVGFSWAFQNFAAQGYAVLYTNPRGSTG